MKKVGVVLALACALVLALTGCASNAGSESDGAAAASDETKDTITIATSPDMEIFVDLAIPLIEEKGYHAEKVLYDDWTAPNTALQEGQVDCNYFQNIPYMEVYNDEYDADFVMIEPRLVCGKWGIYSDKYDSLDEIEDGATVAVSSNPSSRDLILQILQDVDLIKLSDEPLDVYYDTVDVVENPKNLKFELVDYYTILATMSDYDLALVWGKDLMEPGDEPPKNLYQQYFDQSLCGITVRGEDADSQWAQDLADAIATDEYKAEVEKVYPGEIGYGF